MMRAVDMTAAPTIANAKMRQRAEAIKGGR